MDLSESRKVKSRIEIRNKVQKFKNTLEQSQRRMRHKSASVRLADQLYSQTRTPQKKKKPSKSKSKSKSPLQNKKLNSHSKTSLSSHKSTPSPKTQLKSLSTQTSHLQTLVHKTSNLLLQKKQLQQRIQFYKAQLAADTRHLKQTQIRCKEWEDQIVEQGERLRRREKQTKEVRERVKRVREQSMGIKREIDRKVGESEEIGVRIGRLREECQGIRGFVKGEHNCVRKAVGVVGEVKNLLRESQKRLVNETITKEELSDQRANLLIQASQISRKITHIINS